MSKCLVLFVEGDTEVEFYKRIISNARQKRVDGRFDINIECKNVRGVIVAQLSRQKSKIFIMN